MILPWLGTSPSHPAVAMVALPRVAAVTSRAAEGGLQASGADESETVDTDAPLMKR